MYSKLFDALLSEVEGDAPTKAPGGEGLYLLPSWCFDVVHEFVYQFQGFCQFRTNAFAAAARAKSEGKNLSQSQPVTENLTVLSENREAW